LSDTSSGQVEVEHLEENAERAMIDQFARGRWPGDAIEERRGRDTVNRVPASAVPAVCHDEYPAGLDDPLHLVALGAPPGEFDGHAPEECSGQRLDPGTGSG
jgi:hypothetical protein